MYGIMQILWNINNLYSWNTRLCYVFFILLFLHVEMLFVINECRPSLTSVFYNKNDTIPFPSSFVCVTSFMADPIVIRLKVFQS